MELTVSELAALVGGQFASGDGEKKVVAAAAVAEAGEGHVTFYSGNEKYLPQIKESRATAAIVPNDFAETISPIAIRVESPSAAFSMIIQKLAPPAIRYEPGIHSTADVDPTAVLGPGVCVQAHVVIESGATVGARTVLGAGTYVGHEARIGEDCAIAPRVTIGFRCIVGNRVILHSGVVLGADGFGFDFQHGRHVKIPQVGIVQIDDDVEIGANSTIDRARFGRTWIQEGTKIDNLVQVAHNVVIGRHCVLCAQVGVSGSARVGDYVTMAGQVGTVGHVEIGSQVVIGAKSGVSKNIPPKETVFGYPAQPIKEAKETLAYVARLPKLYQRVKKLEDEQKRAGSGATGGSMESDA